MCDCECECVCDCGSDSGVGCSRGAGASPEAGEASDSGGATTAASTLLLLLLLLRSGVTTARMGDGGGETSSDSDASKLGDWREIDGGARVSPAAAAGSTLAACAAPFIGRMGDIAIAPVATAARLRYPPARAAGVTD